MKTQSGLCTGLVLTREDEGYATGEVTQNTDVQGSGIHPQGRQTEETGVVEEEGVREDARQTGDLFAECTTESYQVASSGRTSPRSEPSFAPLNPAADERPGHTQHSLQYLDTGQSPNTVAPASNHDTHDLPPSPIEAVNGDTHTLSNEVNDSTLFPTSGDSSMDDHAIVLVIGKTATFPTFILDPGDKLVTGILPRTTTWDVPIYDLASETEPWCMFGGYHPAPSITSMGAEICNSPIHTDTSQRDTLYQYPDYKAFGGTYP